MKAKHAGKCWKCRGGIAPGDSIEKHKGGFVHASCAPPKKDSPGQGKLFGDMARSGMEARHDDQ